MTSKTSCPADIERKDAFIKFKDYLDSPVLIIGFGIAGIVQCHTLIANGFSNITVVEKEDSFGGVWNLGKQWPGLQAQNTRIGFEFPEMRHDPDNYNDFPTQEQVNAYLKEYIEKFDLNKYVHYGIQVETVQRERNSSAMDYDFSVGFSKPVQGKTTQKYKFVVLATGFTSAPNTPGFLEEDRTLSKEKVTVLHCSRIRHAVNEQAGFGQGKRVVVLGSGKSALDTATWAVDAGAKSVDLLLVEAPYALPQYPHASGDKVKGLIEYNRIFCRALSWLLPCEPEALRRKDVFPSMAFFFQSTWLGQKLRDFVWKMKFTEFAKLAGIPSELVPPMDVQPYNRNSRLMCCYPAQFAPYVNLGKIRVRLGARATGLSKETGQLTIVTPEKGKGNGQAMSSSLESFDIIICATGWKSSLGFLSQEIQNQLYNEFGQAQIYRGVYCPYLPQMAFNGLHLNLNSMFCSAMAARWNAELAKGSSGSLVATLQNEQTLVESMEAGLAFERRQYDKGRHFQSTPPGYYTTGWSPAVYVDCLLSDLGAKRLWRSPDGSSIVENLLGHVKPAHYKGVITEAFE